MKKILIVCLILLLAGCTTVRPTWAELWGPGDGRTDRVDVRLTAETMPWDDLLKICGQVEHLRGCSDSQRVYLQGDPAVRTMLLHVQFMAWDDIAKQCGKASACYENGTLYTYPYDTKGRKSRYYMGVIGSLVNDAGNLGLGFNNQTWLGHELMAHVVGMGHPGSGFKQQE